MAKYYKVLVPIAFPILVTEALAELESQSDNIKTLASLDFYSPSTELQTEKAATVFTTITEFTEWCIFNVDADDDALKKS